MRAPLNVWLALRLAGGLMACTRPLLVYGVSRCAATTHSPTAEHEAHDAAKSVPTAALRTRRTLTRVSARVGAMARRVRAFRDIDMEDLAAQTQARWVALTEEPSAPGHAPASPAAEPVVDRRRVGADWAATARALGARHLAKDAPKSSVPDKSSRSLPATASSAEPSTEAPRTPAPAFSAQRHDDPGTPSHDAALARTTESAITQVEGTAATESESAGRTTSVTPENRLTTPAPDKRLVFPDETAALDDRSGTSRTATPLQRLPRSLKRRDPAPRRSSVERQWPDLPSVADDAPDPAPGPQARAGRIAPDALLWPELPDDAATQMAARHEPADLDQLEYEQRGEPWNA